MLLLKQNELAYCWITISVI